MTDIKIIRCIELPQDELAELVAESEQAGMRFVRRLVDEWCDGSNRFDTPGEAVFTAWSAERLVGVCGLNIDPYARDPSVGRVRHLYVLAEFRRRGLGRGLVETVIASAQGHFTSLRLRTDNVEAAAFYERLRFLPQIGVPACTHELGLTGEA